MISNNAHLFSANVTLFVLQCLNVGIGFVVEFWHTLR